MVYLLIEILSYFSDRLFEQLTLWGVRVEDAEIVSYMKTAGLLRPIHKGVVRAHFNMEDTSGTVILDKAGNNHHGDLVGGPTFVLVCNLLCNLLYSICERFLS